MSDTEELTERFDKELADELAEFPNLQEAVSRAMLGEDAHIQVPPEETITMAYRMIALFGRHIRLHAQEIDRLRASANLDANTGDGS